MKKTFSKIGQNITKVTKYEMISKETVQCVCFQIARGFTNISHSFVVKLEATNETTSKANRDTRFNKPNCQITYE